MSVCWKVGVFECASGKCVGECMLGSVYWEVCVGECALGSVCFRVRVGECMLVSVCWGVFWECVLVSLSSKVSHCS